MKHLILLLLLTASVEAQPLQMQTSQNADSALRPLTTQQQALSGASRQRSGSAI